jgi:hypothetical protein
MGGSVAAGPGLPALRTAGPVEWQIGQFERRHPFDRRMIQRFAGIWSLAASSSVFRSPRQQPRRVKKIFMIFLAIHHNFAQYAARDDVFNPEVLLESLDKLK